jgi:hypothetical protein
MTSPEFTVAFHIGAHKTATTHLQRSLLKASEPLIAAGVRFYGPSHFRLPGRSVAALFGLKGEAPQEPSKRTPKEQLALMRKDAQRLVFSEENYIGVLNGPRRLAVTERYPFAGARITGLAVAIERPVDVLIGIRRPTGFLNSAYCQMLMGGRVMPLQKYKQINPVESVDWLDLIKRLRAADGVGSLTVWRHEDYAQLFGQICSSVVGPENAHLVRPLARRIHESLSAEAVAEMLRRDAVGDTEQMGFALRKMLPVGQDHRAFDGFDAGEHAKGDAAYAGQAGAIAKLPGVTFLQPGPQ